MAELPITNAPNCPSPEREQPVSPESLGSVMGSRSPVHLWWSLEWFPVDTGKIADQIIRPYGLPPYGLMKGDPMFTIGDMAMRAMVYAYREMRANGLTRSDAGTFGTITEYAELWRCIRVETLSLVTAQNAPREIAPYIADMAYAIAMTEQFHLGTEMYNAWRDYEIELHRRAINANR